ncbi:MAG: bacteriocin maturation protein, partial [Bacilli bacterium]|nr:bacteriocin maturation protein [Bacilli bacterium]
MTGLHPFMRLKVKGDTFFLPDPNGGVYFRNNNGSFQLEGTGIDRWIEKLMPVFNGHNSLEDLTEGLPDEYRNRVQEIASVLIQNGMVRDVSQDHPHHLTAEILGKFSAQIEFLDSFSGSGAYLFQLYRQAKVLAVGSGPFFVSLVQATLTSGLPKLHLLVTDAVPTNSDRISQLAAHARLTDAEVAVESVSLQFDSKRLWQEAVQPFDAILYVS